MIHLKVTLLVGRMTVSSGPRPLCLLPQSKCASTTHTFNSTTFQWNVIAKIFRESTSFQSWFHFEKKKQDVDFCVALGGAWERNKKIMCSSIGWSPPTNTFGVECLLVKVKIHKKRLYWIKMICFGFFRRYFKSVV